MLGNLHVWKGGVIADEQDHGDLASRNGMPPPAVVDLPGLIVEPFTRRQIHVSRRAAFTKKRCDKKALAEHIFVLDQPRGLVIRKLEEERPEHGESLS